jgi:uncharacterized RDD family membrane protein YckC
VTDAGDVPIAAYGRRAAAAVIDLTIGMVAPAVILLALVTALTGVDLSEPGQTGIGLILVPVVPLYSALLHRFWNGQTLGKRLFAIAVRREDGSSIDFGQSYARSVLQLFLLTLFWPGVVDSLWPLRQAKRRSLHDLAAGTVVVTTRP